MVNQPIPNLVVLTDSFGPGEDFIESGDGPINTSTNENIDRSSEEDG